MSLAGFIRGYWRLAARARFESRLSKEPATNPLERGSWEVSLRDPNAFYLDCLRYFYQRLPRELREHRAYFHNVPSNRRGFGEDAFHVMWHRLLQEFRPENFLEIGVYRGQVVSLVTLWARLNSLACQVYGISPFSSAGDTVSKYRHDIDFYQDTLANFDHFKLPPAHLLRAYSTDPAAVELIRSKTWAMVYIDGNHDYEVARKDWDVCAANLKPGGIIVLDDSGLTTAYQPVVCLASGGIPGPSKLAQEIHNDEPRFREILQVGHNRVFQRVS